jgi:SAM-dependent methyltransferase
VAGAWAEQAADREAGPPGEAADWMVRAAALAPGGRVLELACGAGDVGLRAAEVVGPEGRVLCTDFAEPMVEVVRERAAAAGLAQVEARVLDAQEGIDDERFDAVLCRFGYMLMPDPGRALAASHRALVGGGRLALAVWGTAERNPWLSLVFDAVMSTLGAPPPEPGTPGPFALADEDGLRGMIERAGFREVTVEVLSGERRFESTAEWWEGTRDSAGPVAAILRHLDERQVAQIGERALAAGEPYGGRFPAQIVAASASA